MPRGLKQIIILTVYGLIVVGIGFGFYHRQYAPTCFDGKHNGQEEGIDCGTLACGIACSSPIQPVQVQSFESVKTPSGDYDLAIQLYNPNVEYGISSGIYSFDMGNPSDLVNNDQIFYMLPGQTKHLVVPALPSEVKAVKIQRVDWQKVAGDSHVELISMNERYASGNNQTTFETTIGNNSDFDFDAVDVVVIVRDTSGHIIATNSSLVKTLLSQMNRYVKFSWPFALPVDARVSVEIGTNVFDNANFIKTHGTQEKFQQLF
jgi:hypothetical protein